MGQILLAVSSMERGALAAENPKSQEEAIADLRNRLRCFWAHKTRDSSEHAWTYLRGLLNMETRRNVANIACRVISPQNDGQNLQHFMSDSPWPAQPAMRQVQREIATMSKYSNYFLYV